MKWKANKKPEIGNKKECFRFAIVPTKINDRWIWLEKYKSVYIYEKYSDPYDEIVSQGIFTEKYRTVFIDTEGWVFLERKELNNES